MAKAVKFDETGGPEVLELREVEVGEPDPGELRIRVEAIGLNRAEVMYREGAYFYQPLFPSGLGYEAAGVVEAIGPDVSGFTAGDTVGDFLSPHDIDPPGPPRHRLDLTVDLSNERH